MRHRLGGICHAWMIGSGAQMPQVGGNLSCVDDRQWCANATGVGGKVGGGKTVPGRQSGVRAPLGPHVTPLIAYMCTAPDGGMLLVVINGGLLPSLIAVCCNQWVKWAPGPPWRRSCWPPAVQRPPRGGLPIGDVTAFWYCNRPRQTPATTITTILHACTKTFAVSRPITTVCRPDHLRRGRREAVLLAATTKGNLSLH